MAVYKKQIVSLVPLLNEATVRRTNKSKQLLGEVVTYTEPAVQAKIHKAYMDLEKIDRFGTEYQLLKVTNSMYLKTFETEKRKLANSILRTMSSMVDVIPYLYSLV